MKIALVVPSIPKYSETFITNKIKGLLDSGFEVVLMVVGVSEKRNIGIPVYYQPILAPSGPMRWVYTFWLILGSLVKFPQKSLKLLGESGKVGYSGFGKWRMLAVLSNFLKIEVDWVHFAYGTMAIERAFIGKVLNAKTSMSLRGYDIAIHPLLHKNAYKNVWPYIDNVHSISKDLISTAKEVGMPNKIKTQIIHPAIDTSRFNNLEKRNWNVKPKFLTVARLHWKKGLEYTLEALALLEFDFSYTIIGEGPEYERLVFAAHQLGIADKVSFAGKKSEKEVTDAMLSHNYYLQYSIQEGFCNAVLEAQAAGMLCMVSDAEGLSENVRHQETGWVVKKRYPKMLTATIAYVINLKTNVKDSISKKATERVKTDFSLTQQKKQFRQFFN